MNKYASGRVARVGFDTAGARLAVDGEQTASWIVVGRYLHICQSKISVLLFGICQTKKSKASHLGDQSDTNKKTGSFSPNLVLVFLVFFLRSVR